jgi:hypothetical protein
VSQHDGTRAAVTVGVVIEPSSFVPGPAPDGLAHWRLADPPTSTLFGREVPVFVLLERLTLPDLEFAQVTAVVTDVDRYLSAAVDLVVSTLRADPAFFGLTAVPDEPGLGEPEVTFGDSGWLVRFAEAPFPIADEYGLTVEFDGDTPTTVEGTADAEEIDWA